MKNVIFLLLILFSFSVLHGLPSKQGNRFFNRGYAVFRDNRTQLIFLDSGTVIGIHRGAKSAAVGRFVIEKDRIRVIFIGNDGVRSQETFRVKGGKILIYQGRALKKINSSGL